jgi:hypothetical protein
MSRQIKLLLAIALLLTVAVLRGPDGGTNRTTVEGAR